MSIYQGSFHASVYVEADNSEEARAIIRDAVQYIIDRSFSSATVVYLDPIEYPVKVVLRKENT